MEKIDSLTTEQQAIVAATRELVLEKPKRVVVTDGKLVDVEW